MTPTLYALLAGAFVGASMLLAIAPFAYREWRQKRQERELENEFLLRVGMDDANRLRMLPDDTQ